GSRTGSPIRISIGLMADRLRDRPAIADRRGMGSVSADGVKDQPAVRSGAVKIRLKDGLCRQFVATFRPAAASQPRRAKGLVRGETGKPLVLLQHRSTRRGSTQRLYKSPSEVGLRPDRTIHVDWQADDQHCDALKIGHAE